MQLIARQRLKRNLLSQVLANFGPLRLEARGTSMLPTLWPGDILHVRACEAGDLQRGAVIVSRRGNVFQAHRIRLITREDGGWRAWTHGDSTSRPDGEVGPENLVGLVVRIERSGHLLEVPRFRPVRCFLWSLAVRFGRFLRVFKWVRTRCRQAITRSSKTEI